MTTATSTRTLDCTIRLTERELYTILAALRNWQMDSLNEDLAATYPSYFDEECRPLTAKMIDKLCARYEA